MTWSEFIINEKNKPYYKDNLIPFLKNEYSSHVCYPPKDMIFNALQQCPINKVKCVIVGQDPYHGPSQAMGMSFSVQKGIMIPPSLKNIFKEIESEYGRQITCEHGDLTSWAHQGVLLLNTTLTVREHEPMSHAGQGWEMFTINTIKMLNELNQPIVYMLWGKHAKTLQKYITNPNQLILTSAHPSPFSANKGFFGNGHFVKCNQFLVNHGIEHIGWCEI